MQYKPNSVAQPYLSSLRFILLLLLLLAVCTVVPIVYLDNAPPDKLKNLTTSQQQSSSSTPELGSICKILRERTHNPPNSFFPFTRAGQERQHPICCDFVSSCSSLANKNPSIPESINSFLHTDRKTRIL